MINLLASVTIIIVCTSPAMEPVLKDTRTHCEQQRDRVIDKMRADGLKPPPYVHTCQD